jgi:hypothetical protein
MNQFIWIELNVTTRVLSEVVYRKLILIKYCD